MAKGANARAIGTALTGLSKFVSPKSLSLNIGDSFDEEDSENAAGQPTNGTNKNQVQSNG